MDLIPKSNSATDVPYYLQLPAIPTDVQDKTRVDLPKERDLPTRNPKKKLKPVVPPPVEEPEQQASPATTNALDTSETAARLSAIKAGEPADTTDESSDTDSQKSLAREILDERAAAEAQLMSEPDPEPEYKHVDRGKHGFSLLGFLRPSDEEIDAQANGMRWHHEMENGWMLSPQWQKTVFAGVDREKLERSEKQQMNARAAEARQRRYQASWDKMIKAWQQGHWDDRSREYKELREALTSFRNAAIARGIDTTSWQIPGVTAGSIQNALNNQITKSSKDMWNMEAAYKILTDYIDKANAGTLTAEDVKLYNREFDKILENATRIVSGTNGTLADAEKVRLQYAALPDEIKQWVEDNRQSLFNNLAQNMASMSRNAKSAEVSEKLATAAQQLLYAPSNSLLDVLVSTIGILTPLLSDKSDLPLQHTAEVAHKQFNEIMSSLMQYAIIDPSTMLTYIRDAYDMSYSNASNLLARANRPVDITTHKEMFADPTKLGMAVVKNANLPETHWAAPVIHQFKRDITNANIGAVKKPGAQTTVAPVNQNSDNPAGGWV